MRVGADGSHLRWRRSGVARYIDGLLHALAALPSGDALDVYYNSAGGQRLFAEPVREHFVRVPRATTWTQVAVPIAASLDRCDVFLGGANIVPAVGRFARVVVMHDCLPFRDPAAKPGVEGRYLRYWQRVSARRATRVIAVSEWSAAECATYLGVDPDQVAVVYQGVDPKFSPAPEPGLPGPGGLELPERFVLQVGGAEHHKAGPVADAAIGVLRSRGYDVSLVRCGPAAAGLSHAGVIELGFVDETRLLGLYRAAVAVCVPSTHEGFGLPVVEAMACGTPVVAARAAALPEAGGEAAVYAEPGDVEGFAAAIAALIDEPAYRAERAGLGIEQAARFRWDRAAAETLRVLRLAAAAG